MKSYDRFNDVLVETPDPRLVALLQDDCDGGHGEFDEFLPPGCLKMVKEFDANYFPYLDEDGCVIWERLQ